MGQHYNLYINGGFIDSADKQNIVNPATGEIIASAAVADKDAIEFAIKSARAASDAGPWPRLTLKERKNFLLKISQGILDNAADLARLETLNTGKPIKESTFMDVPSAAKVFEHFADNLERYLTDETIALENTASRLVLEPQGVAALIVPWNYPLLIASWKLAQALAAGNSVILKPSSLTPLTVLELAKIVHNAGLPKGIANIINGAGSLVGELLCSDKRLDLISFTGSNEVGREIIKYSSSHVKKLIMELGGKSAAVVLKDADMELAVNGSICSIFLNQGQMCTAMSRIFVEEGVYDKFIAEFVEKAKRIKLGNGLDYQTQMGPLISDSQRRKALRFVEQAESEGAVLLCGGKVPEAPEFKSGFFFEPAVFTQVTPKMAIFQEEVFGPVVCINKFSRIEEAVSLANASDFALACSIWSKDSLKAARLAANVNAGIIWINTYGMFYNEIPYGGFKQSGFGKELGREGFHEYCRLKNIITDKTNNSKPLVNYWYGF